MEGKGAGRGGYEREWEERGKEKDIFTAPGSRFMNSCILLFPKQHFCQCQVIMTNEVILIKKVNEILTPLTFQIAQ